MPDKVSIDQLTWVLCSAEVNEKLNLGFKELMIVKAFYLSKMTVPAENESSNYEYTYMHRPEFVEFLPRLAHLKYVEKY